MSSYSEMDLNNRKVIQKRNAKYLRELRNKATHSEIAVKQILDEMKIRYMFQKGFFTPFHRIADFYLPKRNIIIEVDGGYHDNIAKKDARKDDAFLRKRGFHTLRIRNHELSSPECVMRRISDFISVWG